MPAGRKYEQGEVACLTLSGGSQLMRCAMVLNNSSWEKLQDGCPLSMNSVPATLWDGENQTQPASTPVFEPAGARPDETVIY